MNRLINIIFRRPIETRYPDRSQQVNEAVVRSDVAMERALKIIKALQLETVAEREKP